MTGSASVGVVGLGVMGSSLAMNIAENAGVGVAGFDLSKDKAMQAEARAQAEGSLSFAAYTDMDAFVKAILPPRKIILLVPAGKPVDAALGSLLELLSPGDVVVDGGNEWYVNTEKRQSIASEKGVHYMGCGVSGGEEGARKGPSLMAGGPKNAWMLMKPLLEKIAAKTNKGPCVAHMGDGGAGNYVKMVHNGIEYGDMQLIGEAYHLLRTAGGFSNLEAAAAFAKWNNGILSSFLVEITADILQTDDDRGSGDLIDVVLDKTGSKGTGAWTVQDAAGRGIPVNTVAAALNARYVSAMKEERQLAASKGFKVPDPPKNVPRGDELESMLESALFCCKVCSYAQGLALIQQAATEQKWSLDLSSIVRTWQGGCIIRAKLLDDIHDVCTSEPGLPNILLHERIVSLLNWHQSKWRQVVMLAVAHGIPVPAMSDSLAYLDSYRTPRLLSASLIQAQRDSFGGHTYQRSDKEGTFHSSWKPSTKLDARKANRSPERKSGILVPLMVGAALAIIIASQRSLRSTL